MLNVKELAPLCMECISANKYLFLDNINIKRINFEDRLCVVLRAKDYDIELFIVFRQIDNLKSIKFYFMINPYANYKKLYSSLCINNNMSFYISNDSIYRKAFGYKKPGFKTSAAFLVRAINLESQATHLETYKKVKEDKHIVFPSYLEIFNMFKDAFFNLKEAFREFGFDTGEFYIHNPYEDNNEEFFYIQPLSKEVYLNNILKYSIKNSIDKI